MRNSWLIGSFAAGVAMLLSIGATSSDACEPIHTLRRVSGATPTPVGNPNPTPNLDKLCWSGPCKIHGRDGPDTWGQFKIDTMPNADYLLDNIVMTITPQSQPPVTLVTQKTGAVCPAPAMTAGFSCSERYRIKGVRVCANGAQTCGPGQKVSAILTSLDQINVVTSGIDIGFGKGCIQLANGQITCGARRNQFWIWYDICCDDIGQFGAPGEVIHTLNEYSHQIMDNPNTCASSIPRPLNGHADMIPLDIAAPCQ